MINYYKKYLKYKNKYLQLKGGSEKEKKNKITVSFLDGSEIMVEANYINDIFVNSEISKLIEKNKAEKQVFILYRNGSPIHRHNYKEIITDEDTFEAILSFMPPIENLADFKRAVINACKKGNSIILEALLPVDLQVEIKKYLNVTDNKGSTPAHYAAYSGCADCLNVLRETGVNLQKCRQDNNWLHLAHLAAKGGHAECLEVLREAGVDLGVVQEGPLNGNIGWTPAHYAAIDGNVECLNVLRKADVDMGVQDKYDNTPAHKAAHSGCADCLVVLREAGAELGAQDKYGNTPAHKAAQEGHADCLQILLNAGADLGVANDLGFTPAHMAAERGHADCLTVLREAGVVGNDGKTSA